MNGFPNKQMTTESKPIAVQSANSAKKLRKKIDYDAVIYTDGSCMRNPGGRGGYGCILIYKGQRKELSGGFRRTTNNRMEIMSAIAALLELSENCKVLIFSDSQYLVKGMTRGWAKRWRRNNWMRTKKKQAVNADLWNKLLLVCENHRVTFTWIKGHSGNQEHNCSDRLARLAANSQNLPVDYGYERNWSPSPPLVLTAVEEKSQ